MKGAFTSGISMFVGPLSSTLSTQNFQWRYRDMSYYFCSGMEGYTYIYIYIAICKLCDSEIIWWYSCEKSTHRSRTVSSLRHCLKKSSYSYFRALVTLTLDKSQPRYMVFASGLWLLPWLLVGISWGYSDLSWSPHFVITWLNTHVRDHVTSDL